MIESVLVSTLIFLFPLALYCLVLAYANRWRRPLLVPGTWDCIGLLCGLSGFLLWTVPVLAGGLAKHVAAVYPAGAAYVDWLLVGVAYYLLIGCVAALQIAGRRRKTVIYNVDTELFEERFAASLAGLGLDCSGTGGQMVIAPADDFTAPQPDAASLSEAITASPHAGAVAAQPAKALHVKPGGPRYAEVTVDPFRLFCHVTLTWEAGTPQLRREIEDRLSRALDDATAVDNPAVVWLLGFSGLTFGSIIVLYGMFLLLLRR